MEAIKRLLASRDILVTRHSAEHRSEWMTRVSRVKEERELLLSHGEACQIISAVQAARMIPGDMAELGVAYGASAKLILDYSAHKRLHLFDTFDGLPDPGLGDSAKFHAGDFKCDVDSVRKYLHTGASAEQSERIVFHKGLFPDTTLPVINHTFSFVHLDVDLYQSTLDGLRFFYPRMSAGGILISHDYGSADGVNRAFDEFFADKPDPVIELTGYQCMMVKLAAPVEQFAGDRQLAFNASSSRL